MNRRFFLGGLGGFAAFPALFGRLFRCDRVVGWRAGTKAVILNDGYRVRIELVPTPLVEGVTPTRALIEDAWKDA